MNIILKQYLNKKISLKSIEFITKRHINEWHLISSVCLQRDPIIVPEMNWLEKKMSEVLQTIETNDSLFSDHEMRHFEDIRRAKRIASGDKVEERDLDAASKQTAQDFEEFYNQLYNKFTKGSRITQSDVTNDRKCLDRSLDRHLMLVCQQKIGENLKWLLPQAVNTGDETMRQTAERALNSFTANPLEVKFLGNVPSNVYSYKYPPEVTNKTQIKGSKIFFFKAIYKSGDFEANKEFCEDYQWLNRKELPLVLPKDYWNSINKCLLLEELDIKDIMNKNKTFRRIVQKKFSISQ